jgi:hypothetical protein
MKMTKKESYEVFDLVCKFFYDKEILLSETEEIFLSYDEINDISCLSVIANDYFDYSIADDVILTPQNFHYLEKAYDALLEKNSDDDLKNLCNIFLCFVRQQRPIRERWEKFTDDVREIIDDFLLEKERENDTNFIILDSIKRTNLGFPSEFEAVTQKGDKVYAHFRYGDLTLKINHEVILQEPLDKFCTNGYISDENLKLMLKRNNLIE